MTNTLRDRLGALREALKLTYKIVKAALERDAAAQPAPAVMGEALDETMCVGCYNDASYCTCDKGILDDQKSSTAPPKATEDAQNAPVAARTAAAESREEPL